MLNVFEQMMARYEITTHDDKVNAMHEVMQQITLAGLFRAGFFNNAAFYGGTCLRIFYGLQRFSEDMDFSLLEQNSNFNLENYFEPIIDEFKIYGRDVIIRKKEKINHTNIDSAFLKDDTAIYNLEFRTEQQIKIKIEVDKNPPLGFSTEYKLLILPFSLMVRTYSIPDLYAGKMHALLFRKWKNRVKGRDWFDFEWYVKNNRLLNFGHLQQRTKQFNFHNTPDFSIHDFKEILNQKINSTDFDMVKKDVRPFIKNPELLDIWSSEYFAQIAEMIQYKLISL